MQATSRQTGIGGTAGLVEHHQSMYT